MISEDYCSYEVAKLLKQKGFDVYTPTRYDYDGGFHSHGNHLIGDSDISAPTHQMAMKWLREVHNIDIDIEASVGMLGIKVYVPFISTYKLLKDVPSKVHQIKRGIYYKDDQGVIPSLQHFDSYEEAAEVVLKYVLKNLI